MEDLVKCCMCCCYYRFAYMAESARGLFLDDHSFGHLSVRLVRHYDFDRRYSRAHPQYCPFV